MEAVKELLKKSKKENGTRWSGNHSRSDRGMVTGFRLFDIELCTVYWDKKTFRLNLSRHLDGWGQNAVATYREELLKMGFQESAGYCFPPDFEEEEEDEYYGV